MKYYFEKSHAHVAIKSRDLGTLIVFHNMRSKKEKKLE